MRTRAIVLCALSLMTVVALQAQSHSSPGEPVDAQADARHATPHQGDKSVHQRLSSAPDPRSRAELQAPQAAAAEGWRESLLDAMQAVGLICDSPECEEHDD